MEVMAEIGKHHNVSAATVALNWVTRQQAITSTIIGVKNLEQLKENIAATSLQLDLQEIKKLDEISAIAPEYPEWMVIRQRQGRLPE